MSATFSEDSGLPVFALRMQESLASRYASNPEWQETEAIYDWFAAKNWSSDKDVFLAYRQAHRIWGGQYWQPNYLEIGSWLTDEYVQAILPASDPQDSSDPVVRAVAEAAEAAARNVLQPKSVLPVVSRPPGFDRYQLGRTPGKQQPGGDGTTNEGQELGEQDPEKKEAETSSTGLIVGLLLAGAAAAGGALYYFNRKAAKRNPTWKYNQQDYTHYVYRDGKIMSGWSYADDAKDAKNELPEEWKKGAKVFSKRHLKSIGVDPDMDENWGNPS